MGAQLGILPGRRWGSPAKGARMSESKGVDMSKMSMGEKLVGGAALAYLIWVFIPTWYSCCEVAGFGAVQAGGVNGFRGFMILAWLGGLAPVGEVALKDFRAMKPKLRGPPGA